MSTPRPSQTRSRLILLLIVVMFFASFGAALVLRFTGWRPEHTRNHGELLAEPIDMQAVGLVLEADGRWDWQRADRDWTALVRVPASCDAACWERVALLPRVRQTLGRHAPKLHLLLLDVALPTNRLPTLRPLQSAASATALPAPLREPLAAGPEIWLVDPHGYAVLHYRPGYDPSGLRKDLQRLVK
jgi:hypothetical protein